MTSTIDITPNPHLIDSLRNTNISYSEALSELIDNSFDAGASEVAIEISPNEVRVWDNGSGCENLGSMLSLGTHRRRATTRLGRYGVGLKNAVIGLGELLQIRSVCGNKLRTVTIDWVNLPSWCAEVVEEESKDAPSTEILISQLRRSRVRNIAQVCEQIAFTFAPGLRRGKKISLLVGGACQAIMPPTEYRFEESIDETVEDGDCGFRVRAGVLWGGQRNQRKPFIVSYEHRVIYETEEPCKDFSSSSRFVALVELFGKWPLLKHKDGLSDKGEWLHSELHDLCRDFLERLHNEGESIELQELASEMTEEFAAILGREKRDPKSKNGNAEETESGKTRQTAAKVNGNGKCAQRRGPVGSITFTFDSLGESIGRVNGNSKRTQIVLNQDHPFIAASRGREKGVLKVVAISLFVSFATQSQDNRVQALLAAIDNHSAHEQYLFLLTKWLRNLSEKEAR